MISRLTQIAVLLILLTLMAGCARKYRLQGASGEIEAAWPFHRGDLKSNGYVETDEFNGHFKTVWRKGRPGKPAGPLTIYFDNIIYPSAKGRVRFLRLSDGSYLGRLKSKGSAQTGVVVADSIAVYALAPFRNRAIAIDLRSGKQLWQHRVKDATPGSILIGERCIVGSSDGIVLALAVSDGQIDWRYSLNQSLTAPFTATQDVLFVPGNKGTLFALATEDGAELWKSELQGPLVSAVAVSRKIIVASMSGEVYALNPHNGSIVWQKKVGGPIWTAPAVGDGRVFVGNSHGKLFALDLQTGEILWQFERPEVIRAAPIIVGDYLLFGTMVGTLYSLNVSDGSVRDKVLLDGSIVQSPISDGRVIVVATEKGNVSCFGSNDAEQEQDSQRIDFGNGR